MTQDYTLTRLFKTSAHYVIEHITSLEESDIYLRFGYRPTNDLITRYVHNTIDTDNDRTNANFWFGIRDNDNNLVATLHIAIVDAVAEFAFTVHKDHRGKKLGQVLFARGYQLINEYSIKTVILQCLSQNAAMRHIAKKFGMTVITHGSDTESSVHIQYPMSLKKLSNMIDYVIKDKDINVNFR